LFFDLEQEKQRIEAIAGAGMMAVLNGGAKPNARERLPEITPTNFRDQKF